MMITAGHKITAGYKRVNTEEKRTTGYKMAKHEMATTAFKITFNIRYVTTTILK